MKNNKEKLFLILLILLGAVSVLLRLAPHMPNFTPIGALSLFAGLYATRKRWLLAPIAVMLVSDAMIGFYDWKLMAAVYGSFLVYTLLGRIIRNNKSFAAVGGITFAGALFFYLTTNFAVWAFGNWYPHTIQGLILNYELALPFFRNTLLGDLFYAGVFMGSYELAAKFFAAFFRVPSRQTA
jgi:hypothetical protein